LTDLPYDLQYFPTNNWLGSFNAYQTRIVTIPRGMYANALVYAIDGDREAVGWAKSALVNLCGWPTWTHPWMLNRGHKTYLNVSNAVREVAKTYDILYDLLSPEERQTVREALVRNGIETAYTSYVVADMVTNHESNWVVSIAGSTSLAGCLIIGDMDDSSPLEPYLTGCLLKLRAHMRTVYGGDSGFIEGFGYAFGTLRMYSQYLPIFEQTLELDFNWMFADNYGEVLWVGDHDRHLYFSFGDTGTGVGNNFACFPWFIEHFRDPALKWLLDLNPLSPDPYTLHTLRFKTDDVPRMRPELSGAKLFQRTGTVVFRSDNGADPFIFTFRCGPFGNHQHLDQGNFYLHDRGETLITELGASDYYEDSYYQSDIIQPIGHNCILVDGNPHSQRTGDHACYAVGMEDRARITAFVQGKSLAWADGDLSPLYLGNVSSLRRGVLWIAPQTVLMIDRLKTKNGEATMESLFHGHRIDTMSLDEAGFSIRSGKEKLNALVLSPAFAKMSLDPNIVTLSHFNEAPIIPSGHVTLTTETKGGAALLAVVMSTDLKLLKTTPGNGNSTLAELDNALVLVNPTRETCAIGSFSTDGIMAVFKCGGELLVVEGTYCTINSSMIVQANIPLTIILEGLNVAYKAPASATIKVKKNQPIRKVKLDGKYIKNWSRDTITGMISIPVPEGCGILVFEE
jgi:hypothetical protein